MAKTDFKQSSPPDEDFDRYLINDVDDYIFEYGFKVNEKGERVVNTAYIYPYDHSRILVKRSLFKHDVSLLKRLSKLPVCGRSELLRMVIEDIVVHNLKGKILVNLRGFEFLLEEKIVKANNCRFRSQSSS